MKKYLKRTISLLLFICLLMTIPFGMQGFTYAADGGKVICASPVFSSGSPAGTFVSADKSLASAGEPVTISVTNPDGYYLAELKVNDMTLDITHDGKHDGEGGMFSFTMPKGDVAITPTFVTEKWDGTLDLSWYDESSYTVNTKGSYYMYYPAQWEGLAWICSEDLYFLTEKSLDRTAVANLNEDSSDTATVQQFMDAKGWTHAYQYQTNGNVPLVVGNIPTSKSFSYVLNNSTDEVYGGIGQNYFSGKTFYIMKDMDFGGVGTDYYKDKTITTILNSDYADHMSGPNYYPVGSQSRNDGVYMPISAGQSTSAQENQFYAIFCGSVDGQGHIMDNIYCDRGNSTNQAAPGAGPQGGSNWYQSAGLIGRLGMPDDAGYDFAKNDAVVENIAVDGFIYTERSVGAIVGKTLHLASGCHVAIKNCINLATICSTQAKGAGGICGASWNGPSIDNTVNFGRVINGYINSSGGFVASDEGTSTNCYTVGMSSLDSGTPCVFGTRNAPATLDNCYGLVGAAFCEKKALYSSSSNPMLSYGSYDGNVNAISSLSDAANINFVGKLNKGGRYFINPGDGASSFKSTCTVKSNGLANALKEHKLLINTDGTKDGFKTITGVANLPIPAVFVDDSSTVTKIDFKSDPTKLNYVETQTFDTEGLVITATWSDGSTSQITDYTVSNTSPLETDDTSIFIYGSCGGKDYSKYYNIKVEDDKLTSFNIKKVPSLTIYAADEEFDPAGMTVEVTYLASGSEKKTLDAEEYNVTEDRENNKITVSYTYKGETKSEDVPITFLSENAPKANDQGYYEISNGTIMRWFAGQVNSGKNNLNAVLTDDFTIRSSDGYVPVGSKADSAYKGTFDGQNHTVTMDTNASVSSYASIFDYVGTGAEIKNINLAGSVKNSQYYAAALIGNMKDGTVENCISTCSITGNSYVGGLVGYMTGGTLKNCGVSGTVTASGTNIGGLVGYAKSTDSAISISGCYNRASVSRTAGSANVSSGTGGLVGYVESTNSNNLSISDCYNAGAVTGYHCIGGLLGIIKGESSNDANPITVKNCYNSGAVTDKGNISTYSGAVVGYAQNENYSITNTYYLEKTHAASIGSTSKTGTLKVLSKSLAKTKKLASALGSAFRADLSGSDALNGGNPILKWETDSADDSGSDTGGSGGSDSSGGGSGTGGGSSSGGGGGDDDEEVTIQKPVIIAGDGGKITLSKDGTTAIITPDEGYEVFSVLLNGKEQGAVASLTGLKTGDKVTAVFKAKDASKKYRFVDVNESDWFSEYVDYVAENGLMNGTSENTFSPYDKTTRGMLMTILARKAGIDTSGSSPWYQKGLDWAKENDISDGTNPKGYITRQQLATMLYRAAGSPEVNGNLDAFTDKAEVSQYAENALVWAVEKGIMTGKGNGILDPANYATRAEMAAMIMRYNEK